MSPLFRWVVLISLLFKVGLAFVLADLEPQYDERQFLRSAQELVTTGNLSNLWRAPGYQWFMALGLWLGGGHVVGVRLLQVVLSTLTVMLVYRVGRREWGERVGFWAGLFVAFAPSQVAFSHLLWAETLYTTLILLAFERLLSFDRQERWGAVVGAAMALAGASLVRSTGLGLLGCSVLWILYRKRETRARGLKWASVLAGVAAIGVAAWSIPASSRAGCLVIVDLNGSFNLWSGNNAATPEGVPGLWGVGLPLEAGFDPRVANPLPDDGWRSELPYRLAAAGVEDRFGCDGSKWFREEALAEIAAHPWSFLKSIPLKLAAFWSPDFFLARHLVRGWYGALPGIGVAVLLLLGLMAAGVPLVAGPTALAALRPSAFRSLALAWVGVYVVVHAITFGVSRMHFPLVPLLVLAVAGLAVGDPSRRAGDVRKRWVRRGLPWAGVILAAWLWISPLIAGLYLSPGPRYAPVARALGGLRHLPLIGTQYVAWNLARVETSVGREAYARRILEEDAVADRPWSRYLHARISPAVDRGEAELRGYVAAGDDLFASHVALAQWSLARNDYESAINDLRHAQRRRPWEVSIANALEIIRERAASQAESGAR